MLNRFCFSRIRIPTGISLIHRRRRLAICTGLCRWTGPRQSRTCLIKRLCRSNQRYSAYPQSSRARGRDPSTNLARTRPVPGRRNFTGKIFVPCLFASLLSGQGSVLFYFSHFVPGLERAFCGTSARYQDEKPGCMKLVFLLEKGEPSMPG